ncbi:MAG: hypothetical protein QG597_846 [Actinomycetota bacterium]|nr:hypothetical protein [Actinomycetota bacterium]
MAPCYGDNVEGGCRERDGVAMAMARCAEVRNYCQRYEQATGAELPALIDQVVAERGS